MSIFGQKPPSSLGIRQILADKAGVSRKGYDRFATGDSLGPADGNSSHSPFAQRQNRYPSPLRGFGQIPAEPSQFFWARCARAFAEIFQKSGIVIELHRAHTDGACTNSTNTQKGKRACKQKCGSSRWQASSALALVATRFWNRASWAQAQGLARPFCWVETPRPVQLLAQALTSSARTQPTAKACGPILTHPSTVQMRHAFARSFRVCLNGRAPHSHIRT